MKHLTLWLLLLVTACNSNTPIGFKELTQEEILQENLRRIKTHLAKNQSKESFFRERLGMIARVHPHSKARTAAIADIKKEMDLLDRENKFLVTNYNNITEHLREKAHHP